MHIVSLVSRKFVIDNTGNEQCKVNLLRHFNLDMTYTCIPLLDLIIPHSEFTCHRNIHTMECSNVVANLVSCHKIRFITKSYTPI